MNDRGNILEIEALILADFDTFKNFHDNSDWFFDEKTAAETIDPKNVLEQFVRKKANIKVLVPLLRLSVLQKNHAHFKAFIQEFSKMVGGKPYRLVPI